MFWTFQADPAGFTWSCWHVEQTLCMQNSLHTATLSSLSCTANWHLCMPNPMRRTCQTDAVKQMLQAVLDCSGMLHVAQTLCKRQKHVFMYVCPLVSTRSNTPCGLYLAAMSWCTNPVQAVRPQQPADSSKQLRQAIPVCMTVAICWAHHADTAGCARLCWHAAAALRTTYTQQQLYSKNCTATCHNSACQL
jgi:hypothetical protein